MYRCVHSKLHTFHFTTNLLLYCTTWKHCFACFPPFKTMATNNKDASNAPTPRAVAIEEKNNKNSEKKISKKKLLQMTDVESGQVVLNVKHQRKSESGCINCIKNMSWKSKQCIVFGLIIAMFTTIFILSFVNDKHIISDLFLIVIPISAVLMYCIIFKLGDPTVSTPGK